MGEKKNDMFGDLLGDSNDKYKSYNDQFLLNERIAKVDKEIVAWSNKEHNLKWANDFLKFYEKTMEVNKDIAKQLINLSLLEKDNREAKAIIAEDAKAKKDAQVKAELLRAKQIREDADSVDNTIENLKSSPRTEYWVQDVCNLDKKVSEMATESRSLCKKLVILQQLKVECNSVVKALKFDEQVRELSENEENSKDWLRALKALKISAKEKTYSQTLKIYESLKKDAEGFIAENEAMKQKEAARRQAEEEQRKRIAEQRKKQREEEARRIERENQELRERLAKKAEFERQQRLIREEEEAKRQAKLRRRQKLKKSIPAIIACVLTLVFVVLGIFLKAYSTYFYAAGIATGSYVLFGLLDLLLTLMIKRINYIAYGILALLVLSAFSVAALVLNAFEMPLFAIGLGLTTFLISLRNSIARIIVVIRLENNDEYNEYSSSLLGFYRYAVLFSGTSLAVIIGMNYLTGCFVPVLVGSVLLLLSVFVGVSYKGVDQEGFAAFDTILSVSAAIAGIVLLFFSREDTIYGIFSIASGLAIFLVVNLFEYEENWIDVFYAIPLGVALIVMFCHWGIFDEVIKNNMLTGYYGDAETYVIPDNVDTVGKNIIKGAAKKKLKHLTISKNVKTIRDQAFRYAKNLADVQFAEDSVLTEIWEYAFYECKATNVAYKGALYLPDSVQNIAQYAFRSARFSKVYLGSSLYLLGEQCFAYSNVKEIYYNGTASMWNEVKKYVGGDSFWTSKSWDYMTDYSLYVKDSSGNYILYTY